MWPNALTGWSRRGDLAADGAISGVWIRYCTRRLCDRHERAAKPEKKPATNTVARMKTEETITIVHVSRDVINIQTCDNIMMGRAERMLNRWNSCASKRRNNDQAPTPVGLAREAPQENHHSMNFRNIELSR